MISSVNVEGLRFRIKKSGTGLGYIADLRTRTETAIRTIEGEYAYTQWLGDYVLGLSAEQESIFLDHLVKIAKYGKKEFTRFFAGCYPGRRY